MHKPCRPLFFMLGLCLLVISSGCRKTPGPGGLVPLTLQTDWYPQPEMGGFYQAQLEGLYKAQGLDVSIAPGGPFVIGDQQVATGAAQFAMSSSDKVLISVSTGLPLVAVMATMQQDPQAILLHAQSPVHDFADLENRTIAVKPGSAWFAYLVHRYHLRNVREIPATQSVANFLQDPSYIQQCFVTSEPYFVQKAGAPARTMLISSTGYEPYRIVETSQAFLATHPDQVASFVKASIEGMAALSSRSFSYERRVAQAESCDEYRTDAIQRADLKRAALHRWPRNGCIAPGPLHARALVEDLSAITQPEGHCKSDRSSKRLHHAVRPLAAGLSSFSTNSFLLHHQVSRLLP